MFVDECHTTDFTDKVVFVDGCHDFMDKVVFVDGCVCVIQQAHR